MLTFDDIKAAILSRARSIEICDTLQEVLVTTTEDELITAAMPLIVFAYQTGIVDDTLLDSFTEATLNAHGIYTAGTFTLANPEEIFILKNADVTVNLSANSKCKINVLGTANLTVVAADNAYCFIKSYGNATVAITANNNSMINIESTDNSAITASANGNTVFQVLQHKSSTINLTATANSYTRDTLYFNAILTYTLADAAIVTTTAYNAAVVNSPLV